MNLSNPVIFCGAIAFGIVFLLILVVIICCKISSDRERDELKELSQEIEADMDEAIVEETTDSKIENVLSKMQEAIDMKEENPVTFEQEQEENAIISYQELLNSLGAKSSIDIDSIEVYDDELDNQIEISDFNKEIIDSYQEENLDREIFRFQNDYSSEALPTQVASETPVMNFDFSSENYETIDCEEVSESEVYQVRHGYAEKFKRTEFISPIYGIISENREIITHEDDVEKIDF